MYFGVLHNHSAIRSRSYENGKPVPSSQPVPDLHFILLSCRLTCKVVALNIFANIQYLMCRMIGAIDSKHMACRAIGKTKAYLSAQFIIIIKACRLLVSQGVAPNNESTWNLLVSKHPKGGCPVGLPGAPNDGTLPPNFNLLPVLRSFPKLTGAGPQVCRFNISWMQLRFHFKLQFFTPSKRLSIFCPLVGLLP